MIAFFDSPSKLEGVAAAGGRGREEKICPAVTSITLGRGFLLHFCSVPTIPIRYVKGLNNRHLCNKM